MTGTDLCVRLYKTVPVIFEPPCMIRAAMQDEWGSGDVYTECWWGNLGVRDHLEDPGIDGRIILRWIFGKWEEVAWTGSIWLRIGTGGGFG